MKKGLIALVIFMAHSAYADMDFSEMNLPYTLLGQPKKCTLTVHDKGFETSSVEEEAEALKLKNAYADVSIDSLPNVIFHLKPGAKGGESVWTGYDGGSGYRLRLSAVRMGSKILFLRSRYALYKGQFPQKPEASCLLTVLKK